jgi:hypothetical protein
MSRREEMSTELGRFLFGALDESYSLLYVDRRDELPPELYREALQAGREARDTVLQDFVDKYFDNQKWDAAVEAVLEAARSRGINLRSPIVSVNPEDWYLLVEEVMDRDESDGWNVMMSIAARDAVVVGVRLGDGYYEMSQDDPVGDARLDDLGVTFGLLTLEDARECEWLKSIAANGCGHPTALVAIPGDDLFGFLRDLYVESVDEVRDAYVTIRTFDLGLFDAYSGSGWFEQVDTYGGQEFEMDVEEFLSRSWIDNEPGKAGTWTEVAGAPARLKAMGDVVLRSTR